MKKKRIMVIEDDIDIQKNLQDLLESEGYEFCLANNGKTALDDLQNFEELPCLILLDLMMPVMDGTRFREIQELNPKFGRIPVLLMTASDQIEFKSIRAGARGFIKKPIQVEELLEKIRIHADQCN